MAENERTSTGSRSRSVRLRSALDGLPQYVPGAGGTSGAVYKLSSNELPGPLAPAVAAAITDAAEEVNRYPQMRSEEHTSELQSRRQLVCRLLPEQHDQTDVIFVAGNVSRLTGHRRY